MKSFTDIKQSKKLAEKLPLQSADMHYERVYFEGKKSDWFVALGPPIKSDDIIPCWSLAALLNYLREIDFFPEIDADEHSVTMSIDYYDEDEGKLLNPVHNINVKAENFIDACYKMIELLHKENLI